MNVRLLGSVFILLFCTACTSLSTITDSIVRAKILPNEVRAETAGRYQYIFARNTANEVAIFRQFVASYRPYLIGGYVVIDEGNESGLSEKVKAHYYLVLDSKRLSSGQQHELQQKYRATRLVQKRPTDNWQVVFVATGEKIAMSHLVKTHHLTDEDTLNTPIPVTIRINGTQLTPVGEVVLMPFFPILMMYGCAASNCI